MRRRGTGAEPDSRVPAARLRRAGDAPIAGGDWVLYWMTSARRARWNFGLERAAEWARALGKPLVVLEALRAGYPWASRRLHRFVLDGMAENARAFAERGVAYWPYVEPRPGDGRGLLRALAARAALVVTDEYPSFFLPRMLAAAARELGVRLEVVDSLGLVPLRATPGAFETAFAFRRWLQRNLSEHLAAIPRDDPLRARIVGTAEYPREIARRWPLASEALLAGDPGALAAIAVDALVAPVRTRGGAGEAGRALAGFVAHDLARYAERRAHPDAEGTSGFSPYLHFGHLSAHEVFAAVARAEGWSRARPARRTDGRRGWFGATESGEAFLEQLVTWRELGQGYAWHRSDHDRYESLPAWARATLERHARRGAAPYTLEQLEAAATDDPVWNAAQTELLRTGKLHNSLRMLWGKKILEWSPSPREALARMFRLNDRYALDGRDPNSESGIFWCLGRFDRPWGPARPVFGTVRYMSSERAREKLALDDYLERYGSPGAADPPDEAPVPGPPGARRGRGSARSGNGRARRS